MTTETKAPKAEDVERDYGKTKAALARIPTSEWTADAGEHPLRRLRDAALLGVQVPGLREQVAQAARDAVALVKAHDELDAARLRELSALQVRVAELEDRLRGARLVEAECLAAARDAESERDALRAQVEEANRKRGWMAEEHNRMRQERNAALAAAAVVKADREGVWFWEKGGENGLESLSCPVVMEAETLRDLLYDDALPTPPAEVCGDCNKSEAEHRDGGAAESCEARGEIDHSPVEEVSEAPLCQSCGMPRITGHNDQHPWCRK